MPWLALLGCSTRATAMTFSRQLGHHMRGREGKTSSPRLMPLQLSCSLVTSRPKHERLPSDDTRELPFARSLENVAPVCSCESHRQHELATGNSIDASAFLVTWTCSRIATHDDEPDRLNTERMASTRACACGSGAPCWHDSTGGGEANRSRTRQGKGAHPHTHSAPAEPSLSASSDCEAPANCACISRCPSRRSCRRNRASEATSAWTKSEGSKSTRARHPPSFHRKLRSEK